MIRRLMFPLSCLLFGALLLSSCNPRSNERKITILATNDIHGGIEPQRGPKKYDALGALNLTGGMAFFSGAVKAIKKGLKRKYGENAGVLVVDSGDQFQGTLISNYTEGSLVFSAMNDVGYDAAITGNHDYDFGPHGWLVDDVKDQVPSNPDHDPRGVIKALAREASFPILSANTFLKSSIVDESGRKVDVSSIDCAPAAGDAQIDWSRARRPSFLKPYLIKNVAGVRVALIGIDNPETPTTTTPDNVSDLCFRNEYDSYKYIRAQIGSKADVFVMLLHDGNTRNSWAASELAKRLYEDSPKDVDVIVSGHTHYVYNLIVDGIPVIQSGHGGTRFGRIDLVYNEATHSLERSKTVSIAGAYLDYAACDPKIQSFCKVLPDKKGVSYEGVPVTPDPAIVAKIAAARRKIAPMATRILGTVEKDLQVNRINESALGDALTDAFRSVSKADIAIMNNGGIRTDLKPGAVTYEDLFKVLPFNNHGYVVGPMTATKIVALLTRSIESCGEYGALSESGLRITYLRDCTHGPVDPNARLLHVETLDGKVLLDASHGIEPRASDVFTVATLDFLAEGGSGYTDFIGTPRISDLGVLREVLADQLMKSPADWNGETDGRLTDVGAPAGD